MKIEKFQLLGNCAAAHRRSLEGTLFRENVFKEATILPYITKIK
jgi:hypothetical protein